MCIYEITHRSWKFDSVIIIYYKLYIIFFWASIYLVQV